MEKLYEYKIMDTSRENDAKLSSLFEELRRPIDRKYPKCSANWPKDGSFQHFQSCKTEADRICLNEAGERALFCEHHGKYRKLVAQLPKDLT